MPYMFPDLKGSGRDLIITNKAQLSFPLSTVLANTQGTVTTVSGPASPGVSLADPTGFFAPVYGSGDEAISVAVAAYLQSNTTTNLLLSYGVAGGITHWNFFLNPSEQPVAQVINTAVAAYIASTGSSAPALSTSHMLHAEYRTGATREVNIWVDAVLVAQTRTGPSGTPNTVTGTERLFLGVEPGLVGGNTTHPMGAVAFKRGRYTAAERMSHVLALNAA